MRFHRLKLSPQTLNRPNPIGEKLSLFGKDPFVNLAQVAPPGDSACPQLRGGNALDLAVLCASRSYRSFLCTKLERANFSSPKVGGGVERRGRNLSKTPNSQGFEILNLTLIPQSWGRRGAPGRGSRKHPDSGFGLQPVAYCVT